jgi:hypothetical protein
VLVEKMKSIAILHMSDLHRSKENQVSHKALLESLQKDFEDYSKFTGKISFIVNLVCGISNVASSDLDSSEIKSQYDDVRNFIVALANDFVEKVELGFFKRISKIFSVEIGGRTFFSSFLP